MPFTSKLRAFLIKPVNRIESIVVIVLVVPLLTAAVTSAATTISTSIETGGNLSLPFGTNENGKIKIGGNDFIYGTTNGTGGYNMAVGFNSGTTTMTGINNVIIGHASFGMNTTGYANNAVGTALLQHNTTGYNNNVMGDTSLLNNTEGHANTAIGDETMPANTTGYQNTALGADSLFDNVGGHNNVSVGYNSGGGITTGIGNTFIGVNANTGTIDGLTNATAIGYNAQAKQSNSLILGNGANVGIGTSTPSEKLVVDGNLTVTGLTNGVKIFRGLLNQAGTNAPTVSVLENTFGGTITFDYVSPGIYKATLAGAFPDFEKFGGIAAAKGGSDPAIVLVVWNDEEPGDGFFVTVTGTEDGIQRDGVLDHNYFEIRVYP